jgi:hypothetical protein
MSWFGEADDITVYSAGISVTHLIPEMPRSPLTAAVLSAIRSNGSIVNNIVAAREQSMFSKVENYLEAVISIPALNVTTSTFPSKLGKVLPILTIRENNVNVLNSYPVAFVKGTKKALATLGMDLTDITAASDAAPVGINDVYFMLACRIGSPTKGAKAYFYHFLDMLYDPGWDGVWWSFYNGVEWRGDYLTQGWKQYKISRSNELEFTVRYLTINKQTITGVIGTVGTYRKVLAGSPLLSMAQYDPAITNFDTIACSKQINATQYVRYTIYGLEIDNHIQHAQDYTNVQHTVSMNTPTGTGNATGLFQNVNGADGSFLLPMFKEVLDKVNVFDLEQMITESIILYVHTVSQSTVLWYQSAGFFNIIGEIVSIATQIFSGSSLNLSPDLVSLIRQVAVSLLTGIVSEYLYEALAPVIGEATAAAIVGVTALVVLHYAPEGNKSLGELPWAEDLLKATLAIVGSLDKTNASEALQLTKDIDAFNKSASAFGEELDRATKLLGTTDSNLRGSNLNDIIGSYETPDEFYTRTIHQGNIGITGIDAIANYTANKLRLPKQLPA